ncbi:MAG: family 10 glycosylhydrolase [Candidatus Sericytochromatia bacterium]|nr:family 10 glycosylhydrolase [Candidatus Sericytochromatia bacterium]
MFKGLVVGGLGAWLALAGLAAPAAWAGLEPPLDGGAEPPPAAREFRGVWIASVRNIDWPSKPGLPVERQQAELRALLDRAVALKLNAVVLQVRPACDAFYDSPLEPWSEYLSGAQGQAPEPRYDPLAFAVAEAHARGLELHAWFNPFRVRLLDASAPSMPTAPNHVSVAHPEWVKRYGKHQWLDPGEPAAQDHVVAVVLDVVKRYDIDAVHMDDYFYPYREPVVGLDGKPALDAQGKPMQLPFPDDESWARYRQGGGPLGRDDWRRDNVNRFVKRLHQGIRLEKPWVRYGISPFGIWKPGHPGQVKGMNQFEAIYADAKLWLERGWVDYFSPQLYWSIENPDQSYPVLLRWWVEQNKQQRHVWPGLFTSRIKEGGFDARQVGYQVFWTRLEPGASGHVHFSMKALNEDYGGIFGLLTRDVYQGPALVPATPWLAGKAPGTPSLTLSTDRQRGTLEVSLKPTAGGKPWLWTLYTRREGRWRTEVVPADRSELSLTLAGLEALQVAAVDRLGQEGPRKRLVLRRTGDGEAQPEGTP